MRVLLTGASGFLGTALASKLASKGNTVFGLSRHPPAPGRNLIPLLGDITQPNLGLEEVPKGVHSVYHLAAIHKLGRDKDGDIWRTNVEGTENVIDFCLENKVRRLYFCSTAYTIGEGRNIYEKSKILCEKLVKASGIPHVTIFKPSVVMGTKDYPYPGHFSQFVSIVIKIHQRAELVRRKIEGTLRLPVLEPVFRVKGNPEGRLNLVPVDLVIEAMAGIKKEGTYWLTNPNPPTLGTLVNWVGEFIMVKMKLVPYLKPTPIELLFQRLGSAFEPYLHGDDFPSDLKECPRITREFIHEVVIQSLSSIDKGRNRVYNIGNR